MALVVRGGLCMSTEIISGNMSYSYSYLQGTPCKAKGGERTRNQGSGRLLRTSKSTSDNLRRQFTQPGVVTRGALLKIALLHTSRGLALLLVLVSVLVRVGVSDSGG